LHEIVIELLCMKLLLDSFAWFRYWTLFILRELVIGCLHECAIERFCMKFLLDDLLEIDSGCFYMKLLLDAARDWYWMFLHEIVIRCFTWNWYWMLLHETVIGCFCMELLLDLFLMFLRYWKRMILHEFVMNASLLNAFAWIKLFLIVVNNCF